jgi:hypothetical protein
MPNASSIQFERVSIAVAPTKRRFHMKRMTVPAALAALLAVAACDQSATTSKPDTPEKPGATSDAKPAAPNAAGKKPTTADAPAKKKGNPCKGDRKKLCADKKDNAEALACLKEHQTELSTGCRASLKF